MTLFFRSLFLTSLLVVPLRAEKPNIVIFYADDMGVADVSYGDPLAKIQTPNIDQLARSGMTFSDGHSSSGICSPSRFALLTGQHHWRRFHQIVGAFGASVFKPDDFTIPKMLNQEGYQTGCFGKWHLGWNWDAIRRDQNKKGLTAIDFDWTKRFPGGPIDHGFDYYFGDGTINFPPYCWIENDQFITTPVKPVIESNPLAGGGSFRPGPMAEGWNPYDVLPTITEKAISWITKQKKDQPFFAYIAFNSPHYPIVPNKEYHGKSRAGFYGDFIVETDTMIGQVMDTLHQHQFSENTLVLFTSDNGAENLAFERLKEFQHWSSGSHRGVKRDLYEGGHRVPFIVQWPRKIQKGSQSTEVISQVDLAATLASIVGYKLKEDEAIDSYDFLPVLTGREHSRPLRIATVQNTSPTKYALRQDDWVLITSSSGAAQKEKTDYLKHFGLKTYPKDTPGLLFNLKDDPRQSTNLYQKYPERVTQMTALLKRYLNGQPCAPRRPN